MHQKIPFEIQKPLWLDSDCFVSEKQLTKPIPKKHYRASMHSHEFYEINFVLGGSGYHKIENATIHISEGDVFVIPPKINHGYYETKNLNVFHIIMKKKFIDKYKNELSATPGFELFFEIEPYLRQLNSGKFFASCNSEETKEILSEIDRIAALDLKEYYDAENIAVLNLISRFCLMIFEQQTKNVCDPNILRAMEYISKHLDEKLSIKNLSGVAYMSESTFVRKFKKITGTTPMQYVLMQRIKTAEELLSENVRSKTEIAHKCGFYDMSHMSKYINSM